MASQWKRLGYLLGLGVLVLPLIAACGPAAAPSPTPAPAAAPTKAAEPAKPAAATQEPYKIGFVNSFSGYMAAMGGQERDGVLMLEEKVNKEGGISGRPIRIVAYDDESDETKGVLAVKKLIAEDKVLGIIGTSASGIAMAQVPVAEDAGVPWIT